MSLTEKAKNIFPGRLFPLWLSGFISSGGDSIHWIALLWLIYDLTGSRVATGFLGSAQFLPAIFFGLFAGVLVDRFDRRKLMMFADFMRACLVLVIPLLLAAGYLSGIHLGLFAFAIAIFTTIFRPARDALVPELVPKNKLTQANSLMQSSMSLSWLIGPIVAAAALPVLHVEGLFYIDALTYLASFTCLLFIKKASDKAQALSPDANIRPSAWGDLRDGLKFAMNDGRLRGLLLITAVDNTFIMGPSIVGLPIYVRDYLHHGPGGMAAIEAAFASGVVIGSIFLHRYGSRLPKGRTILIAMIIDGITYIPLMWTTTLWTTFIVIFIHSLFIPFIVIPRTTLIQEIVEPRMQGRIFSMINLAVVGLTALSTTLTGIVAEWISMPRIYAIFGGLAALVGLWGWAFRDFRRAK